MLMYYNKCIYQHWRCNITGWQLINLNWQDVCHILEVESSCFSETWVSFYWAAIYSVSEIAAFHGHRYEELKRLILRTHKV